MNKNTIRNFIQKALEEDVGEGDFTTLATIPENVFGEANLYVKEKGILAGVSIAKEIFQFIDPKSVVEIYIPDGTYCDGNNNVAFKVFSNIRILLKVERLVLNILQRMSGIATITNQYVKAVEETKAKILDTRKTTPGFRYFEKLAVKIGGGCNHRMGLYDQILIKDNHIDFAGGIDEALKRTKNYLEKHSLKLPVECEARNIDDVIKILKYDFVETILLDNFTIEQTKEAVKLISNQKKIESSGGINLSNVRDYALCGVDYISIGSLTHHVRSLDLSLKAKLK
jgi:nicotinate-nucleotide pyrophosphorylase (carboxylating)